MDFLLLVWREADYSSIKNNITLYVTHGDECHQLNIQCSSLQVSPVCDLASDHEESEGFWKEPRFEYNDSCDFSLLIVSFY